MTPIPPDYLDRISPAKPLTPEQFASEVRRIAQSSDEENRHMDADKLLCDVLASLGYGEGVKVYVEMEKWYA